MAQTSTTGNSPFRVPDSLLGVVATNLAVVTGFIHLLLAPQVLGFSQQLAILFALNGLGFLGGTVLYLTNYWRRELYLVAAGYALITFVAFFVYPGGFEGFVAAFSQGDSLNWNAIGAKTVEVLLAISALALYSRD